jgi:hypothetical protein
MDLKLQIVCFWALENPFHHYVYNTLELHLVSLGQSLDEQVINQLLHVF